MLPVNLKAIRGMRDILMEETPIWQYVERQIGAILAQYGYREIRLPIVEKAAVFTHSIGEQTDIVSKEMYTFPDHRGNLLSLRPEGTASCVRAGIEHGLFYKQIQRIWYSGPMFRYERPQQGRQRQFHQIGIEVYGAPGPDIDAELILICARIWRHLQIQNLCLELNSLGNTKTRQMYRNSLVNYFSRYHDQMDEDSRQRLEKNPLRILDSKNPAMAELIAGAPSITEQLDDESRQHLAKLRTLLDSNDITYRINPRLVRGLDYYNKTIFEWSSSDLGAQSAVCAGGRYDRLTEHFADQATPATGFALGLERLIQLIKKSALCLNQEPHIYLIIADEHTVEKGVFIGEMIRTALPKLRVVTHCGGGSLKSQFKKADRMQAKLALILGNDELEKQSVGIKFLRETCPQIEIHWDQLVHFLSQQFS